MIKIDKGGDLRKILLDYDIVLFDFMGVISNGSSPIDGASDIMKFLKQNNKIVSFVSNAPVKSINFQKHLSLVYNIEKNTHYDFTVTSGDVSADILKDKLLKTKDGKEYKNCYIFGKIQYNEFLRSISYNITNNLEEADFIYIAYPQLSLEEYNNVDEKYRQFLFESAMYDEKYFDSTNIELFTEKIKLFKKYNLPMFSDCQDLVAMQKDKNNQKLNYVIRQGSITTEYKKLGGEVVDVSKPSSVNYDYTFKKIKNNLGVDVKDKKILMIGDTIDTDVLGACNATKDLGVGVDAMLTLCGVAGKFFGKSVDKIEEYAKEKGISLKYVIDGVWVIGE